MRVFILLILLAPLLVRAQERCATDVLEANQSRTGQRNEFESWMKERLEARKKLSFRMGINEAQQQVYQIPVVFHIVHDGSAEGSERNVSKERIVEQIKILNEDFRRTNADASSTPNVFLPVAADTEIQFVLAKQDPEGLPTDGIVRVAGSKQTYDSNSDADDILLKSESFWPPEDYLNIYVTDLQSGYLGYAQYPFSNLPGIKTELSNYRSTDGVVIDYKFVGSNDNTGTFDSKGRTATHEIGHFLGLRHIWGEGACGVDDFCDDTPTVSGSNSGKSNPCSFPGKNSCTDEENDLPDMFQNYMDYSDDECMNLFTLCQKQRMRTVLELSPRRSSLLTSHALKEPVYVANDLGIRRILSPIKSTCSNLTVPEIEVRNYGTNPISSFEAELSLNGTLIETANFTASLEPMETAYAAFSSLTLPSENENEVAFRITKVNEIDDAHEDNNEEQITLTASESIIVPYAENFDNNEVGALYRTTEYQSNSLWTFENQSAQLPFYNQTENYGVKDMLLTKVIDMSSLTSAELTFRYAYASRSTGDPDSDFLDGLIVAVSTNCGQTFAHTDYLFESYGQNLATTAPTNESFLPETTDWGEVEINLTNYTGHENVQVAIIGVNGGGNNIFVDDINIVSANLLAHDAGFKSIGTLPVVTCDGNIRPRVEVRNFGYARIETIEMTIEVDEQTQSYSFDDLNMLSGFSKSFSIDLGEELSIGTHEITFTIDAINGIADEQPINNLETFKIIVNEDAESIPVKEDFVNGEVNWTITNPEDSSIFQLTSIGDNYVLAAKAFESTSPEQVSYFVSPSLNTSGYNEAAIRFKYSYAERSGFNDNLKVLLSFNCGRTYETEVLNFNAERMAVASSNQEWIPGEADWDTAFIDISEYIGWEQMRVAFAFTNGNGNNLYLDDIEIITTANPNQPEFDDLMVIYPNPTDQGTYNGSFNVTLNLLNKQDVEIRIIDMSGKVIFSDMFPESLNQTYYFQTPKLGGMYLVQMLGSDGVLNQVKRLYVRR